MQKTVMTFWTFDLFHPGHEYYLTQAKKYGKLITIISRDENVNKLKWRFPVDNEQIRLENVKNSQISDIVELGDSSDYLACIRKHNPEIICLWYDQTWFIEELKKDENFKNIEIIRLKSYKPEIYKSSILREKLNK